MNSFTAELCSSDRTGRLVTTEEIQARSSEDTKSLNVEQTHDRTGRLVKDTVAVQADHKVYHEAETLNIDKETIRERIEADMDFKIPGLPHSFVKHVQSTSVRQTSIVYFAAIETERRRSSKKSTMGTEFFFFFMVELARFIVCVCG